jgi:hypothetical protein
MPRLFYNRTVLDEDGQVAADVNPLVLQRYLGETILVIAVNNDQLRRLCAVEKEQEFLLCCGWWNLQDLGLVEEDGSLVEHMFDGVEVVIVLNKEEVDPRYHIVAEKLATFCCTE